MIEVRNVAFQYTCSRKALTGINWSVGPGMHGLLGPNGAGKTTLLRLLATLSLPSAGEVWIDGVSIRKPEEIRTRIGYLPQLFDLPQRMSVAAFLDYVIAMRGIRQAGSRRRETDRLLHELNLTELSGKRISTLSGGMKQRVGLAQAMAGSPQVLIVDEPTVGLDPEERLRLRNLLSRYSSEGGRTVLLSTHLLSDVELSCRSLSILGEGRMVFTGTSPEVAEAARGRVWVLEMSEREFARLHPSRLIRASRTPEGIRCKLLSRTSPGEGAVPVEPVLEDGYLALIGGESAT